MGGLHNHGIKKWSGSSQAKPARSRVYVNALPNHCKEFAEYRCATSSIAGRKIWVIPFYALFRTQLHRLGAQVVLGNDWHTGFDWVMEQLWFPRMMCYPSAISLKECGGVFCPSYWPRIVCSASAMISKSAVNESSGKIIIFASLWKRPWCLIPTKLVLICCGRFQEFRDTPSPK
ncbi:hypothetical protein SUGI_1143730 [Cryptomeria japonica]|nr:hypothetical protein SUGI_1143730 [Cryptomeria japonica]